VIDVLDTLGVRPADADAREAALAQSAFAPLLATRPGDPTARRVEPPHAVLRVDAIGLGQGLDSRLKERGYDVVSFNASRRCEDDEARERFQNQRAEAFDRLRTMLLNGEVTFPTTSCWRRSCGPARPSPTAAGGSRSSARRSGVSCSSPAGRRTGSMPR
jgi:hypothetical protein